VTWLGLALKAFFSALLGKALEWLSQREREQLAEGKGRAEAEREQAREGESVQGDLADEASRRVDADDAIAKLERGEA
jgi:hypothetical protein